MSVYLQGGELVFGPQLEHSYEALGALRQRFDGVDLAAQGIKKKE